MTLLLITVHVTHINKIKYYFSTLYLDIIVDCLINFVESKND